MLKSLCFSEISSILTVSEEFSLVRRRNGLEVFESVLIFRSSCFRSSWLDCLSKKSFSKAPLGYSVPYAETHRHEQ